MNIAQARAHARQARSNLGRLLFMCSLVKGTERARYIRDDIKKNQADLKRLYAMFPEIKPIRYRQLSLFPRNFFGVPGHPSKPINHKESTSCPRMLK